MATAPREWCPDCRSRRKIIDTFTESTYDRHGEMGFTVTELDCGHYNQTRPVRVGPAPGAPSVKTALPNLRALRQEAWA